MVGPWKKTMISGTGGIAFLGKKKCATLKKKSYGVMPYGRRLTSLAVVVVRPLALFASTLSSSKRRNENGRGRSYLCRKRPR